MAAVKPTSIREAIARWEKENEGQKAVETKVLNFSFQVPFIEKIDPTVTTLAACEHLSLSTNNIEKIANLNGLKNLKILSLGRNKIKVLTGLDAVGETLEQLWISYNLVEKLKGINVLKNLRADLPLLEDLVFVGNPIEEHHSAAGDWRDLVAKKLPKLKKLDGVPIIRMEEEE
ncbi:Dynein light chain 1, axonemal [Octopus vulgaris]|uniref:Dynein light chain 1, axonemal n=2 Tax=Octopus TaxID=6643 RepID=A0AA36FDD5_OCTVU|nr:dynein light chain 1, axonemal-like isoform X2 [Octopus sinensis]CAI9733084.1 Dynein light chain 1, axonemal [Octopus vulgaris]